MLSENDFNNLFRQYYTKLLLFAMQIVSEEQDCHDIVSNVFEDVWTDRQKIHKDTARQLLYTSVRNRAIDHLRRQKHRNQYLQMQMKLSEDAINNDSFAEREEREMIVKKALATLDDRTRAILEMCYVEGLTYKEVAERLSVSISTVKKYMVKALRTIRNR